MTVQDSDKFLVDRGGTNYQITTDNLMAELLDDDLMLVSRDGTNYKATGADIKGSITPPTSPPVLTSISLVEVDPDTDPRFTDSSFVASLNLSDEGSPVAEKVIDAYVEGAIRRTGKFDAPLESSNDAVISGRAWQNNVSAAGSGTGNTANMFNGNLGIASADYYYNVSGGGQLWWDTRDYPLSGSITVHTYGDANKQYKVVITKGPDNEEVEYPFAGSSNVVNLDCGVHNDVKRILLDGPANVIVSGYSINGQVVISNQDIDQGTELNFAAGTDMTFLASGDEVTQRVEQGGTIYSDHLTANGGFVSSHPATNSFDGVSGTYSSASNGGEIYFNCTTFPLSGTISVQPYWDNAGTNSRVKLYTGPTGSTLWSTKDVTSTEPVVWTNAVNITYIIIERTGAQTFCGLRNIKVDGEELIDGRGTIRGTVGSVNGTAATLTSSSGDFTNGVNVTGPTKTIITDNARKYLQFNSNGDISDLLDAPQDPPYSTVDPNPSLTLTFPSLFPSGQAPDDELGDETTLTVTGTATNIAGSSGPIAAIVQPVGGADGPNLTGLTTLYTGNNFTHKFTTGIDLVNNDGMVWIKSRSDSYYHYQIDTLRGRASSLSSNINEKENTFDGGPDRDFVSFDDDGFTLGQVTGRNVNNPSKTFAAWTFEKAAGYFDVIKMTKTNGTDTVQHNLGQKPGMIIGKNIDTGSAWLTYHSGVGNTRYGVLSDAGAWATDNQNTIWVGEPTDTEFSVGTGLATSGEHIFYVFAEDTPGVIKCGTYIGNNTTNFIDVGFDPQWVLIKPWSANGIWSIMDTARGSGTVLQPHVVAPEITNLQDTVISFDPGGFTLKNPDAGFNANGIGYMYVAIAAPPIV